MSSLLEHLLVGDELLAKRDAHDANTPPGTKPVGPHKDHLTAHLTSTTTLPMEAEPQLAPPLEPEPEVVEARAGVAPSKRVNTPEEGDCVSAAAAPPGASDTCASVSRVTPVIFVGFGIGTNSLLHLAAGPLRQERGEELGEGSGRDGGRHLCDDVDGELNETEGGRDTGGGVEAGDGFLTSILYRKGFRMGGLVLVNGFVSLDEQSTQARGLRVGFFSELWVVGTADVRSTEVCAVQCRFD